MNGNMIRLLEVFKLIYFMFLKTHSVGVIFYFFLNMWWINISVKFNIVM